MMYLFSDYVIGNVKNYRDLISRTNSIEVLIAISETPGMNQNAIITGNGRNSKLKRLNEFVEAGLIKPIEISKGRTEITYYLTSDGKKFVKYWLDMENDNVESKIEKPLNRMDFLKKPCGDTLLLSMLALDDATISDLESICKENAKYLRERLEEAERLGFILRLGRGSDTRYSLTEEGRTAAENLERYRDCVSPPGNAGRTPAIGTKDHAN